MDGQLLLALFAALALFVLVGGGLFLASALSGGERKQVRRRLAALVQVPAATGAGPVDFARRRELSGLPWLHGLLEGFSGIEALELRISRAKAPGAPGTYLLASAVLGLVLGQAAWAVSGAVVPALGAGCAGLWLPFGWLSRREKQRMEAFQRQLGEALELMGRALRAGHTFGGAMRMVADEFPDPVAGEFGQTLDEINFGLDAGRALAGLLDRVDCPDLKFFVTALNIQRETGGNLAEIVTGIAALIRERYKLFGRVRVLSSEGRLSAIILIALPFAVAGIIHLLNPTYMTMLASEPLGRILAWGAVGLMGLGAVVIRRMVNIKV